MLDILINIFAFFIGLGFLVAIHEASHFYTAKLLKFKILKFSIGFPILGLKPIFSKKGKDGVIYELHLFLLGGFVQFLDKRSHEKEKDEEFGITEKCWENEFTSKSLWKRYLVVLAGPLSNIILTIILFWGLLIYSGNSGFSPIVQNVSPDSWAYKIGLTENDKIVKFNNDEIFRTNEFYQKYKFHEKEKVKLEVFNIEKKESRVLEGIITEKITRSSNKNFQELTGITFVHQTLNLYTNKISNIQPNSIADKIGLKKNDKILKVNNVDSNSVLIQIKELNNINNNFDILYERNSKEFLKTINYDDFLNSNKKIGIAFYPDQKYIYKKDYSLDDAFNEAISKTYFITRLILNVMNKMITGEEKVKDNISGPLSISKEMGDSLKISFEYYIRIIAFLSLSLGIMNLLPIPTLDGGHLVMFKIEALIRRPVPEKLERIVFGIGFILVMSFMLYSFIIDIQRHL